MTCTRVLLDVLGAFRSFVVADPLVMSFRHNARPHLAQARRGSMWMLALAVSASACGPLRRVPKTTASVSPSEASESQALFTSANGPPTRFVASTSDAKTTRVLTIRDGLTKPAMFRIASDYLSERYTVDVSDPKAGFLMTPWQATLSRDGVPELRYRTRIVLRFLGEDWKQLAVRAEANWLRGEEWEVGYDAALLDSVNAHLNQKLGKPN